MTKRQCTPEEMQTIHQMEQDQSVSLDPELTMGCQQPYGNSAFAEDNLSASPPTPEGPEGYGTTMEDGTVEWASESPGEEYSSEPEVSAGEPAGPVEFCHQTAGVEKMARYGIQHHWLRTPNKEAGLGASPGESIEYGAQVEITDHSGRGDQETAHCYPAYEQFGHSVDQACVDEKLTTGRELGSYGINNQCQSTVADIAEECRTYNGWAPYPNYATDPDPYQRYSGDTPSGTGGAGH